MFVKFEMDLIKDCKHVFILKYKGKIRNVFWGIFHLLGLIRWIIEY